MDLIQLSREDLSLEEYKELLAKCVTSKDLFLRVIETIMHSSFYHDDIDQRICLLAPYFEKYKMRKSTILKTSHVFCKTCSFYKPSALLTWAMDNKELFETEVVFYYKLFAAFPSIIKDVPTFPLQDMYELNTQPVFEQNKKERLKMLNSVVTFFLYYPKTT